MPGSARLWRPSVLAVALILAAILPVFGGASSLSALGADDATTGETGGQPAIEESFVVGRVKAVTAGTVDRNLLKRTGMVSRRQMVEVEVREGPRSGSTIVVPNEITDNPAYNVAVRPGDEVILAVTTENGRRPEFNIADHHRAPVLGGLLALFLTAFLVFGGRQGFKALVGLLLCGALICFVLLPLSMQGFNPLVTAVFICLVAVAASMSLVAGFSRKSLAAILGTIGGIIAAGVSAQIVIGTAHLTGLSSEEAQILRGSVLPQPAHFYTGLLAAGMLIGALGVIMDVGISIASAVWEVSRADRKLTARQLYKSGMNVGRDIMGTMTNTLVLAYAGSALPLLLLACQIPSIKLLNLDLVATEVAATLTGSLGLVLTIPLTALAASRLMCGGAGGDRAAQPVAGRSQDPETIRNAEARP